MLLREGRASVQGKPAANALEFAEAASSLGVDRGVQRFARFSLLKRRGESYVALPTGTFPAGYRAESDLVRKFQAFLDVIRVSDLPKSAIDSFRGIEAAIYHVLLKGGSERMREMMAAFGRMLRAATASPAYRLPSRGLAAGPWLLACGFDQPEVRIAAAVASLYARDVGSFADHLSRFGNRFAWIGSHLSVRLISVLDRRLLVARASEFGANPFGGACALHPSDATRYIAGELDEGLLDDLLFAFSTLDWTDFETPRLPEEHWQRGVLPVYAVLKSLFLPGEIQNARGESKRLAADPRILSLLQRNSIDDAAEIAVTRLRIAGFRPLLVAYEGGVDPVRLAASLLIPVWPGSVLAAGILHHQETLPNE